MTMPDRQDIARRLVAVLTSSERGELARCIADALSFEAANDPMCPDWLSTSWIYDRMDVIQNELEP